MDEQASISPALTICSLAPPVKSVRASRDGHSARADETLNLPLPNLVVDNLKSECGTFLTAASLNDSNGQQKEAEKNTFFVVVVFKVFYRYTTLALYRVDLVT